MNLLVWGAFLMFVLVMLSLDLGVFHRDAHRITFKEALAWTCVWVASALLFNGIVFCLYEYNWLGWTDTASHHMSGQQAAIEFFTGYVIEKSLSVDNIFVIAMIFSFFRVPAEQQHRVLFWGILGALVLRGIMIGIGAYLIARFQWTIYVFGLLLLASATKMLLVRDEGFHPDRNLLVRLTRRVFPVTGDYFGSHFFVRLDGRWTATPLLLTLVLVESSDVMFAIDSIPAIFAVTRDPFLVFTSNIFAILGLRSLYFVLAGLMEKFRYLKMSLVFLLAYVGVKMMLAHHYPIPNVVSLAVIAGILAVGVAASLVAAIDDDPEPPASPALSPPIEDPAETVSGDRQAD